MRDSGSISKGQDPGPVTTFALVGTSVVETTVVCPRCEWEGDSSDTGKGLCPKCACFLPKNSVALKHGARRFIAGCGSSLNEAERVATRDAVIEDLGGKEAVSEVMRQIVEDFAYWVTVRDLLGRHVFSVGTLTRAGRRRACFGLYLEASRRVERLAKLIGTARRAARVGLAEYVETRAEGRP